MKHYENKVNKKSNGEKKGKHMKYKVIDLHSEYAEETTGTCDLCYGTDWVENGYLTVEDENGEQTNIYLTEWDWGDYDTIYIDNVVNFAAWLQEQDVPEIITVNSDWAWLDDIVHQYNERADTNNG